MLLAIFVSHFMVAKMESINLWKERDLEAN
jgi:hypothetical protein